ncbi:leucyl aminopeptidase [Luteococcus sp. H138]|uniref:leucyl aminopeptidase n=1 Tax=unclassified Luteococcus TaxID=2639923 RepID=UPI00313CBA85
MPSSRVPSPLTPGATLPAVEVQPAAPEAADYLVVGVTGSPEAPVLMGVPANVDKLAPGSLQELAVDLGAKPDAGAVAVLPRCGAQLLAVGVGTGELTPEQVRRSTGAALREAVGRAGERELHVAISLNTAEAELVRAAIEGALLGGYEFVKVGSGPRQKLARITVVSSLSGAPAKQMVAEAQAVAQAVLVARDWINTPANLLYPESFAADVRELVKGSKLEVEVLDEKQLAKEGFGGILAVGGGSQRPPRLVRLEHKPRGAKSHLVLVGKGVTFDTGGLNLKTADGMYTMKCDMSGAAAVLAATRAIAELGLGVWVTCYASLAENMPSGAAYRPSDVITMYGGTTVENANSDAEGRLVMADALARTQADKPDLVVDVATLTGACMVALGNRIAGLMTSDDATADLVLDAAETAGEEFWQLPIPEHLRKGLESKVADVKSSGGRLGGALTAAAFLQHFVGQDTAWAHLDIAGPAFNDDNAYDYVPVGGTGHAVRTLVELARGLQS